MTSKCTDDFSIFKTLDDDALFNVLQSVRVDLFEAEHDIEGVDFRRVEYLEKKIEALYTELEIRGLNAHKQF